MHTTNYVNTLITVSPDTKAREATEPPTGKGTIAELQFAALRGHAHQFTSDDIIFGVHADRHGIPADARPAVRDEFFSRGQPCLRTSPLAKTYGWGIHSDEHGRVALVPMETPHYRALLDDDTTTKRAAMKSSR